MAEFPGETGATSQSDLRLDELEAATRLRLFGFVRRDDQLLHLWVLRAMDCLRIMHHDQGHGFTPSRRGPVTLSTDGMLPVPDDVEDDDDGEDS